MTRAQRLAKKLNTDLLNVYSFTPAELESKSAEELRNIIANMDTDVSAAQGKAQTLYLMLGRHQEKVIGEMRIALSAIDGAIKLVAGEC